MIEPFICDQLCENIGGRELVPNYRAILERAVSLTRKRKREEDNAEPVVVSRSTLLGPESDSLKTKNVEGQQRLDVFFKFMQRVDEKYMRRSLGQRDFHRCFLVACLPHVVGETAWSKHRAYYLALFDEDSYKAEVLVTTPRRFGKTTAVAMFVAALMCCCPRMWVSIFSTGKRASKSLLVQIKEVISSVPTMEKRVISSNVEELWVQPVNTTTKKDQSRCYSYPSSVKGLKGVSAKVIVMEEASRLSTDVFYEVVVPLLGVNNTAVLGISTPLGEDNYYSALTGLKDENDLPLFRSLSVELVCPVCRKKNEEQMSCVHRMDVLPPWKSQGRQEKVKRIMASVPELFMQEAMGIVVSSRHGVFSKIQTENLAAGLRAKTDLPPVRVNREDPIFISVDPTGGGASKMALVSFAVRQGTYITISMENILIPRGDIQCQTDLIEAHMKMMRDLYPNNAIVLICEANMSWVTASHFAHMCKPFNILPMVDERSGNVGIVTTQESKENGVLLMQTALQNKKIRRSESVFCVGLSAWTAGVATSPVERFDQCTGEAIVQASRFKKLIKEGADVFQKSKIEFSGKDSANQDDLVMSWIIAFYFITKYTNSLHA